MRLLNLFLIFFTYCVFFSYGISFPYVYLKYFKKQAIDIIEKAVPKDDCSKHLKAWIGDLFNIKKLWALQMLDATAKPNAGFLAGNIMHWGHYDQCLQIREDKGDIGVIEGLYCTVVLIPIKNASSTVTKFLDIATLVSDVMGIKEGNDLKRSIGKFNSLFGLCLPKSCSADNLQKLWDYIELTFRLPLHIAISQDFCFYKGKVPHVFHYDKYVFWAFGLFFSLIGLATIYDILIYRQPKEHSNKLWEKILISFSVDKNIKNLFQYAPPNAKDPFSCINGLKVICMLWVIFGHRYTFGYVSGIINMMDYFEWRKGLVSLITLLAPFAVDTFLTISGLLLTYKYMEIREILPPDTSFPYFQFYFVRFLRLWPALIATTLTYISILKYLNDGPLWNLTMYKMAFACSSTGWLTALFMTNMIEFRYQCVEQSWYLAVDTQLYCMAPIFLYCLYKYPKRTSFSLITLSFVSSLYAYIVTVDRKLKWSAAETDDEHYSTIYLSSFVRMPPWIFGLLTGALLYNYQHIKIPKVVSAIIWIIIVIIILGIAKTTNAMIIAPYNEYTSGLYNATARSAWGLAICFLIAMCATGHGGIFNEMLSSNIFKVMVKFSYSTFLLHLAMIALLHGDKRSGTFLNSFRVLHDYMGDLPFIFVASIAWSLAFESPFINIAKVLMGYRNGPKHAGNDGKKMFKIAYKPKQKKSSQDKKQLKVKNQ